MKKTASNIADSVLVKCAGGLGSLTKVFRKSLGGGFSVSKAPYSKALRIGPGPRWVKELPAAERNAISHLRSSPYYSNMSDKTNRAWKEYAEATIMKSKDPRVRRLINPNIGKPRGIPAPGAGAPMHQGPMLYPPHGRLSSVGLDPLKDSSSIRHLAETKPLGGFNPYEKMRSRIFNKPNFPKDRVGLLGGGK